MIPTMGQAAVSAGEVQACSASCITEYLVQVPVVYDGPFGIVKGPRSTGNKIGRLEPFANDQP